MNHKQLKEIYSQLLQLKIELIRDLEIKASNKSIRNLHAYLNLRSLDVTYLQNALTSLGLSSLGRSQGCVIDSINKELQIVSRLLDKDYKESKIDKDALNFEQAKQLHLKNSEIFGKTKDSFTTKVMVTLPSQAGQSKDLIEALIKNGASVLRINTAHDNIEVWKQMARYIKEQNKVQKKDTKIYVDLAGPKIRTKLFNEESVRVFIKDKILITPEDTVKNEGISDYKGVISCTNKEIFKYIKKDENIFIDDGKIGCKIIDIQKDNLVCEVFLAKFKGSVIKAEKGINFPSTNLYLEAITKEDEKNFQEIVSFADIIGISFAQDKNDIKKIQKMLKSTKQNNVAIAPKIETKRALENLPQIIEQLLEWENYALMIARGDLAIEVGFENLPYIQEEILNICEAAHVPVIYATQILEGKMKKNLATRAEVTDAAVAQRADCIMLNKGPYVVDTLLILKQILRQMHTQFQKNRQLLNVCKAWKRF